MPGWATTPAVSPSPGDRSWTGSSATSRAASRIRCSRSLRSMPVDVETVIEIARPRAAVAAYACDPDNATAWYRNIKRVEWQISRPLAVGSRIAFEARFLGRSLVYTYQVRELQPGESMVMSTSGGPFAMETVYRFRDSGPGLTEMRLRNRGEPSGFSR